jgi:hypothetical protein
MRFKFEIEIEVQRVEGKFASRDEIEEFLQNEIEGALPSEVDGVGADGSTTYEVIDSSVSAVS